MPDMRTLTFPDHARSRLESHELTFDALTGEAARSRARCLDAAALLVLASWRDPLGAEHVGCWLRAQDGRGAPVALSVGAHAECDVGGVAGASLRHALVLFHGSGSSLEVIDLRTREGLWQEGQRGLRRLLALRAVAFGAGTAELLALTLLPGEPVEAVRARALQSGALSRSDMPCALPRRARPRPEHSVVLGLERGDLEVAVSRAPITRVSLVEGDPSREHPVKAAAHTPREQVVHVDEAELAEGVLLGRYERCAGGGLDERVSRVHAYVAARRGELLVVDVGSSNGTAVREGGRLTRLTRLHRAATVSPGGEVLLAGRPLRVVPTRRRQP